MMSMLGLVVWDMRDNALLPGVLDGLETCVPDLTMERLPEPRTG